MAELRIEDARIEAAFAAVPREQFLGPGPWPILRWMRDYVTTPSDDPVYLYTDTLVGILPERRLNNGRPSFLAKLISCAGPLPGEHAVHIGAGLGYFTAILAELVGHSGAVTAIELDPGLAARAEANFAGYPNVRVVQGDGTLVPFEPADVIFVNAGATRPADNWLDGLKEGGRLILPLTTNRGFADSDPSIPFDRRGAVFRIERRATEFLAQRVSAVAIFPCEGARDSASETALAEAFKTGSGDRVTRLWRHDDVPEDRCWLRAPGWCLTYDFRDLPAPTPSPPL
jgi:protein-L-isoaspartate(D-aspartate) O-methyltransferase